MTYSRRAILAAGATGTLALSAGCIETIVGDLQADQAAPTDEALGATEFAEYEITEETISETIDFIIEEEIEATIWISSYTRGIEIEGEEEEGAAFAAISSPRASVLGQSFNPLAEMDNEEKLDEFGDELDGQNVENITHEGTSSLSILGEDRDVDRFVGEREFEGEPIDVEIHITSFEHEDDYLVLLGVYPEIESLRAAAESVYGDEVEEEFGDELDEHDDDVPDDLDNGDGDEFDDDDLDSDTLEEAAEAYDVELPDSLPEDIETLFESVEHPA